MLKQAEVTYALRKHYTRSGIKYFLMALVNFSIRDLEPDLQGDVPHVRGGFRIRNASSGLRILTEDINLKSNLLPSFETIQEPLLRPDSRRALDCVLAGRIYF